MRWIAFLILAGVTIVLQTTIVYRLELSQGAPDLMFIVAMLYALHAPSPDAMIAAWVLGFITDLFWPGRVGVHAFSYGLLALVVVQFRDSMFRDHPLTSLFVTLVCAWIAHLLAGVHYMIFHPQAERTMVAVLLHATVTAMFTAILAPYVHWLLIRMRALLGLLPPHRLRTRGAI